MSPPQGNGLKFCNYYAIVMLDGDSMGRWLSGEFLVDKTQLLDFHKKLTKELGSYAACVDGEKSENGIKEPKGQSGCLAERVERVPIWAR